jgi:hypothetical protein
MSKEEKAVSKAEVKQGINPIWFLIGMGVLIALILGVEILGLKPK